MLEKMGEFFDKRLSGYDEHMLTEIESANEFYPYTAGLLPKKNGAKVLDLGCGTGLELEEYFKINGGASVVGIDLAPGMLGALKKKLGDRDIKLILGSYFEVDFGEDIFDAAVSVESLHHFMKEEKIPLYGKLYKALKSGGYFILTDYFAASEEDEKRFRQELIRLKHDENISDGELYHFDTPLTVAHECEALREAGFESIDVLNGWGATYSLRAKK
jgi:tRNA (cmo5U34)-methyltransferase